MSVDEADSGLVVRSAAGFVDVLIEGSVVRCRMRGRLKRVPRTTDLCVIGDRVMVERTAAGTHVVVEVEPRATRFSRRHPGPGAPREDVLVANLEQLVVTFCHGRPPLNLRLLDRFLVIAEHQGVRPLIVMNKRDLRVERDATWRRAYETAGYAVVDVSARSCEGVDRLQDVLRGRISAFVGPSGVGKSSLINRLCPELDLSTAGISEHHGKGRHTTRVASLYPLPAGGFLADTPGVRELGAWSLPVEDLDRCFPELATRREACAFRRCSHTHEPRCAVIDAVLAKEIDRERYESYVRLRDESAALRLT